MQIECLVLFVENDPMFYDTKSTNTVKLKKCVSLFPETVCLLTCISDGLISEGKTFLLRWKMISFFVSCRPATTLIMQHLLVSVETQMEEIHVEDSLRTQSNNMFFLPTYNIYNVLVNSAFQSDSRQYFFLSGN